MSRRFGKKTGITVGTTVENSSTISLEGYASGLIHIPTGSSITELKFKVSADNEENWDALHDSADAEITRTVAADRCYAIPDELFGASQIRLVGNFAGSVGITMKA